MADGGKAVSLGTCFVDWTHIHLLTQKHNTFPRFQPDDGQWAIEDLGKKLSDRYLVLRNPDIFIRDSKHAWLLFQRHYFYLSKLFAIQYTFEKAVWNKWSQFLLWKHACTWETHGAISPNEGLILRFWTNSQLPECWGNAQHTFYCITNV